jgi:hypothetical protein
MAFFFHCSNVDTMGWNWDGARVVRSMHYGAMKRAR